MSVQIHLAVQYLAAAGCSFLDKESDNCRSSIMFNRKRGYLETLPLNDKGYKIVFDYLNFSIYWIVDNTVRLSISLHGKTHKDIIHWLKSIAKLFGMQKPFAYQLDYILPNNQITDEYTFKKPSNKILKQLLGNRRLAQNVIEETMKKSTLISDIRIWPHYFHTSAIGLLYDNDKIRINLGFAVPDTMIDDYYFYISGYRGHDGMNTSAFKELSIGTWKNDGFKGAVLPTTGIDKSQGVHFFNEALAQYKN